MDLEQQPDPSYQPEPAAEIGRNKKQKTPRDPNKPLPLCVHMVNRGFQVCPTSPSYLAACPHPPTSPKHKHEAQNCQLTEAFFHSPVPTHRDQSHYPRIHVLARTISFPDRPGHHRGRHRSHRHHFAVRPLGTGAFPDGGGGRPGKRLAFPRGEYVGNGEEEIVVVGVFDAAAAADWVGLGLLCGRCCGALCKCIPILMMMIMMIRV